MLVRQVRTPWLWSRVAVMPRLLRYWAQRLMRVSWVSCAAMLSLCAHRLLVLGPCCCKRIGCHCCCCCWCCH